NFTLLAYNLFIMGINFTLILRYFPDKRKFVPLYYKYNQKSMSFKGLFMLKILVRLTCVLTP
ncbi:MAG: hypothetical protein KAX05_06975, partial [Bacteroidales bacterium]|nr:hypothetical protein [Bacteroidales bacterium]